MDINDILDQSLGPILGLIGTIIIAVPSYIAVIRKYKKKQGKEGVTKFNESYTQPDANVDPKGDLPEAYYWELIHTFQRQELNLCLHSNTAQVIIIPGIPGSGHEYVALRTRHDMWQQGQTYWSPVPAMNLFDSGIPIVQERDLIAAIYVAATKENGGRTEDMKNGIAEKIKIWLEKRKSVVFDLKWPVSVENPEKAAAFAFLIQRVWTDLMSRLPSKKPVFLLLRMALPLDDVIPAAEYKKRIEQLTATDNDIVRVVVLKPLESFEEATLARFFEMAARKEPDCAVRIVREALKQGPSNHSILEWLREQFWKDFKPHEEPWIREPWGQ